MSVHAETQKVHEHRGKLELYIGAPPAIVLSGAELIRLAKQQTLFKRLPFGEVQCLIVVFRVYADTETIRSVIKDFNASPRWIRRY